MKFRDGVEAVVIIDCAKVKRVVSREKFWGVNDKTDVLFRVENMVEIDIEILVAQMNFNEIQIAYF